MERLQKTAPLDPSQGIRGISLFLLLLLVESFPNSYASENPANTSTASSAALGALQTGDHGTSGNLEVDAVQYLSFPKEDVRSQVRPNLLGHITLEGENKSVYHSKVDAGGMISPGRFSTGGSGFQKKTSWYAYIPEVYAGASLSGKGIDHGFSVYFGRRKQEWSQLDEYWQLGLWQPRFRWDCLSPESQGLTGAFFEYRGNAVQWTALGTALFIPEQGPSYDLKDGHFTTESPCFEAPTSKLEILSQQTEINYKINMPPITRILFQPAGAATLRLGHETGSWMRASYAYKLINQIFVDYDGYLQINPNQAHVDLTPRVAYHQVATLESGVQGDRVSGWISVLGEKADKPDLDWNLTGQEIKDSIAVGPTLSWNWTGSKDEGAPSSDIGYMRVWGGNEIIDGPLASSGSMLESHYAYHDVATLGFKSRISNNHWHIHTRLRHDFSVEGDWLSTEVRYSASRHFSLGVGGDLLSVGPSGVSNTTTLISRFRGNDRVYGGIRYAF